MEDSWKVGVFVDDQLVAWCVVVAIVQQRLIVDGVETKMEHRCRGYGQFMFDAICAHFKQPLSLCCYKVNFIANLFYLKIGFEFVSADEELNYYCKT